MEKKPLQKSFSFDDTDASYDQARSSAQPIWSRRSGPVSVAIWQHDRRTKDGQEFVSTSLSMERGYKDKNDKWQKTNSLRPQDLPRALVLLRKAEEYLLLESTGADHE